MVWLNTTHGLHLEHVDIMTLIGDVSDSDQHWSLIIISHDDMMVTRTHLEHDDDVTLIEDVAGGVDGHPREVLDLLGIPGQQKMGK